MNERVIAEWLGRRVRRESWQEMLGVVVSLGGGILLLVLTWGITYAVSLFAIGTWIGFQHWIHWVLGLVLIPLLFVGNARTSREYLSDYSVTTGTVSGEIVTFYMPGVGMVSNVNPLAPDTMHTGVKMITDCLYVGPRVVTAALRHFRKGIRLRRIDATECARVIEVLHRTNRKMSFQEIVNAVEGMNPVVTFPQLSEIEGVIFLQKEPAGLVLSAEVKEELNRLRVSATPDAS